MVTLLFTDIEASTRLLEHLGDRYAILIGEHHRVLRAAFQEHGGEEMDTQGDSLFYAFPSAKGAVLASIAAQRGVVAQEWPEGVSVRVRMGLHTGELIRSATGYVAIDVHRAARICSSAWGGQILLFSSDTRKGVGRSFRGIRRCGRQWTGVTSCSPTRNGHSSARCRYLRGVHARGGGGSRPEDGRRRLHPRSVDAVGG